jgi:hypothetical protein
MFKRKFVLMSAAGDAPDGGGAPSANTPPAGDPAKPSDPTPAVDAQALVREALAQQEARFAEELKKTTGFSSFKEFNENRMKEQGKLQELADAKEKEARDWQGKYEQSQIRTALLAASAQAVDPSVIVELLSSRAVCGADGQVMIANKPVEEAVKALLEEKPFLAKAEGGTGSGSPQHGDNPAKKQLSRASFEALEPAAKSKFIRDGGRVV